MPGNDDDQDMETLDGLKLTPGPMDYRDTPAPAKSTAQYAMDTIEKMQRTNAKQDALAFKQTIGALEKSNTGLRIIVLVLVVVLLAVIAGLLSVGVTGSIPGVGEVEITPGP
jgi:hypothetical protein